MTRDEAMEAALKAHVALIGHTGASQLEIGYLEDDVPIEEARWWARARLGMAHVNGLPVDGTGAVVMVEEKTGPVEALEALALKLIDGGICQHCHRIVQTMQPVPHVIMVGESYCLWSIDENPVRWVRECGAPMSPNR